jgi:hypothetical protein
VPKPGSVMSARKLTSEGDDPPVLVSDCYGDNVIHVKIPFRNPTGLISKSLNRAIKLHQKTTFKLIMPGTNITTGLEARPN